MPHGYLKGWVIISVAAVWFLIMGTLPLMRGSSSMSPNSWIRVSGALMLIGLWFPIGWLGTLFGNEAYGIPIMLVAGVVVLFIGMVVSLSK